MYTNSMYAIKQPSMSMTNVYRAKVVYSDSATGEIRVIIPALIGPESQVAVSYWGRSASNGVWVVPDVDAQIVVAADDYQLTNVFWLQISEPAEPVIPAIPVVDNGQTILETQIFG